MKDSEKEWFKMNLKNKAGLSGVVTVVILIALTIAIISIVWVVINNLVNKELEGAGSCFGVLDKVSFDSRYTCYNSSGKELWISVSIGNIDVDEVLISISGGGTSKSFRLNSTESAVENLGPYPLRDGDVKLPGKNAGLTYIFDMEAAGFTGAPDSIEIAPIIGGSQCSVSDTVEQFDSCASLV